MAVADLTLTVQRGEVFGFLGPNGAGKTTSVKMLLTLIVPTNGSATLLGKPLGDRAVRAKIGFLPEHFRFHEWLKAAEFLDLHGRLHKMPQAVRRLLISPVGALSYVPFGLLVPDRPVLCVPSGSSDLNTSRFPSGDQSGRTYLLPSLVNWVSDWSSRRCSQISSFPNRLEA